jgi:hypothetical protein
MADLDNVNGAGRRLTITPEVLRGLRAMACALTAPQAEHPDVRMACAWLRSVDSAGRSEDEEDVLDKTKQSLTWWDAHTVVQLVVTHLNEHGARVLFALPDRGIYLAADTPEQAEQQLAFARKRWPDGVYAIREVRFWRDADGNPGSPVHTLVDDTLTPSSR